MFDSYEWNIVEGSGTPKKLTLLGLSTCAFCASARNYLVKRGVAFRHLNLDKIAPEEKAAIKAEFREKFARRPSFPTLIIDGERFLIGFIKEHWDEEIS